ncbi:MAG: hypothetical protein H7831_07230 [Magnetococcus sp. WYHC-3]
MKRWAWPPNWHVITGGGVFLHEEAERFGLTVLLPRAPGTSGDALRRAWRERPAPVTAGWRLAARGRQENDDVVEDPGRAAVLLLGRDAARRDVMASALGTTVSTLVAPTVVSALESLGRRDVDLVILTDAPGSGQPLEDVQELSHHASLRMLPRLLVWDQQTVLHPRLLEQISDRLPWPPEPALVQRRVATQVALRREMVERIARQMVCAHLRDDLLAAREDTERRVGLWHTLEERLAHWLPTLGLVLESLARRTREHTPALMFHRLREELAVLEELALQEAPTEVGAPVEVSGGELAELLEGVFHLPVEREDSGNKVWRLPVGVERLVVLLTLLVPEGWFGDRADRGLLLMERHEPDNPGLDVVFTGIPAEEGASPGGGGTEFMNRWGAAVRARLGAQWRVSGEVAAGRLTIAVPAFPVGSGAKEPHPQPWGQRTVLVVRDGPVSGWALHRFFSQRGARVMNRQWHQGPEGGVAADLLFLAWDGVAAWEPWAGATAASALPQRSVIWSAQPPSAALAAEWRSRGVLWVSRRLPPALLERALGALWTEPEPPPTQAEV